MDLPRLGDFLLYLSFRRPCEKRVLVEFLNGMSVGHIAQKLRICESTCRTYVAHVHREHEISSKLELLEKALHEFWRRNEELLRPLTNEILELRHEHERRLRVEMSKRKSD